MMSIVGYYIIYIYITIPKIKMVELFRLDNDYTLR